jgi:hypothetical protein
MNACQCALAAVVAATLVAPTARAQAPEPTVRLEYHWLSEGVGGPSHVFFDASGEDVAVSDSLVLTLDGVARADVVPAGPRRATWDVIVRLTPQAASAFADVTAAHVGHRLAVVLDGQVVQVVSIEGRLGRVAGVLTDVPRARADSVVARLNAPRAGAPGNRPRG